ncbi:MAG: hypothetical protein F6K11_09650 [Leptolyngbya sp. SIO3F4]|nr:hypothetical protein [Leptolyngbya sp. SIO3F4]
MDSSSTYPTDSTSTTQSSTNEQPGQREAELLNLVRDLNECNDVLLAKVSQLEESLEHSQAALQAEIDRSGPPPASDREIVQLVTELEQSNQALHHHQTHNENLQTELNAFRERTAQLETEHATLLQQHTKQSQELLQANTNCRDLRARLQRQQRYTMQFKAALEKCLSMSTESSTNTSSSATGLSTPGLTMPTVDEIRPWVSAPSNTRLDPQLASMIRGDQRGIPQPMPGNTSDTEAEDQLWHDLARVMDPSETPPEDSDLQELSEDSSTINSNSPEFTEPSPWKKEIKVSSLLTDDTDNKSESIPQLSPEASEILARVQASKTFSASATDTYLPAMTAQSSPSPLVNPLKPQKRIGSLSAIDLPNFPRLKRQAPNAKA